MSSPIITTGGKDRLPAASALLSQAFATDPVITYLLHSMSASRRSAFLPDYFTALLRVAGLNGASFEEARGVAAVGGVGAGGEKGGRRTEWESCGVLMPPGKRVDNFWTLLPAGFVGMLGRIGVGGSWRMIAEFTPLSNAAKAKGLQGRKLYFYVFFLGTHPESRKKGLCSVLVKEYQTRAAKEGVPLWLEATTEYSMRLYERLGFRIVEEMVLGKGKVGADGLECKGGEGVKIWGMIWEAEEVEKATT